MIAFLDRHNHPERGNYSQEGNLRTQRDEGDHNIDHVCHLMVEKDIRLFELE